MSERAHALGRRPGLRAEHRVRRNAKRSGQGEHAEAKCRGETQKQTPMNEASTLNHAGFHGRLNSYNSYQLQSTAMDFKGSRADF